MAVITRKCDVCSTLSDKPFKQLQIVKTTFPSFSAETMIRKSNGMGCWLQDMCENCQKEAIVALYNEFIKGEEDK